MVLKSSYYNSGLAVGDNISSREGVLKQVKAFGLRQEIDNRLPREFQQVINKLKLG